jgi:hypothetical protein
MYTPDEYMSAQLMQTNPAHFVSGDWELRVSNLIPL